MKIFLTGSTGLVGANTALTLLDAGHDLRLLVRDKTFAQDYFASHGHLLEDFVVADMRDEKIVRAAMVGCDAVLHAAAMVSLDESKADEIYRSNLDGISAIIGSAVDLGIKNIVYVSSLGVFYGPGVQHINEQTPLGVSQDTYSISKRDCEDYVRRLQQQGAPIQITYPSGIFGPDDPRLSESSHGFISLLQIVPRTTSGMQCIDTRDLALIHLALLENPPINDFENARYIAGGNFYSWDQVHSMLENIVGKKIFSPKVPGVLLRFFGVILDLVRKFYPIDFPISHETMIIFTQSPQADSSKIADKLGLTFRSGSETFKDTILWLAAAGHVDNKSIGKLAPAIDTATP